MEEARQKKQAEAKKKAEQLKQLKEKKKQEAALKEERKQAEKPQVNFASSSGCLVISASCLLHL